MSHEGCFYQNIKVNSIWCHIKVLFIKIYKLIALKSHKGCFYQNIQVNSFDAA